jgi:hypothetical protein
MIGRIEMTDQEMDDYINDPRTYWRMLDEAHAEITAVTEAYFRIAEDIKALKTRTVELEIKLKRRSRNLKEAIVRREMQK